MGKYDEYLWMVIAGGISCFTMGFGIGANDVANNFGSSVGSGAIKFRWAVLIAACFELIGAVGFGSSVTDSVRNGIIMPDHFADRADVLMYGNFAALVAGTLWLIWASQYGLPVSTTHTVVGALFGVGLATGDMSVIDWGYLGFVVLSWVTSPVLSCFMAMLMYCIVREYILRAKDPVAMAKNTLWVLVFALGSVLSIFFILKNPSLKSYSKNKGYAILTGFACGLVLSGVITPIMQMFIKRKMAKRIADMQGDFGEESTIKEDRKSLADSDKHPNKNTEEGGVEGLWESDESEFQCTDKIKKRWYAMPIFMDLHRDALSNDLKAAAVHDKAEKFPDNVEAFFCFLQIISACMSCIVHGSNDVANATAPFSTVMGIYEAGKYEKEVPTPYWILALGGSAIGVGVVFLGHRVIQSIGIKLVKITPSRGFCIEISMSLVMVIGSMCGIPLSTTHCQVGATVGVGVIDKHLDFKKTKANCGLFNWSAVNMTLIGKIVIAWIGTLIVAAVLSAAIFSLGVYSPTLD